MTDKSESVCPECNGHGRIVNPWATEREALEGLNVDRCPTCGGDGRVQIDGGGA